LHHRELGEHPRDRRGARTVGAAAAAQGPALRARLCRRLRRLLVAAGSGLLLGLRFRLGLATLAAAGRAAVAVLLRGLPLAVVGRVEAGALVVDRDRVEDELDGSRAALVALFRRRGGDGLEALEMVPVGAAVLVDRHSVRTVPAPQEALA